MSETKVVVALLTGLAAGAVLGILFAPEAGTETRDKLAESLTNLGESLKDSAAEQIDKLVSAFRDKIDNIQEEAGQRSGEEHTDDLEHA